MSLFPSAMYIAFAWEVCLGLRNNKSLRWGLYYCVYEVSKKKNQAFSKVVAELEWIFIM